MPNESLTIEQVLSLLPATPPRIATLTTGLTRTQLHTPPDRDEWSINDVLAHLRASGDVWGNCMVEILTLDRPTLRAINPRTWFSKTDYLEQEFHSSLRAFTNQRTKLLAALKPLAHTDWSRAATLTGARKPLERTVLFYARWLASHERPHLRQIECIVLAMRT